MPRARLKLDATAADDWLADLSTTLPETTITVLATIPTERSLLGIVEVRTADGETFVRAVEDAPQVRSCDVFHADDQVIVLQFRSEMTESYDVLLASGTVPQYPVTLRDGWFSARLEASQERLAAYFETLSELGIPYEIVSLTHSHDSSGLLTDRQRQVVTEAVARGYYATPQRCTLAELAEAFDVGKSAVSKLLRRAEGRIVTEFVSEAAP
ncbi:helix-turn-helix domain-containing protein [Halosolutus gelatinilyticus]|uniref:helix-turn-helix domain-containing protein n=1 Tax=Halosolutus gelatinilyticus TaxID=2931975 RepID=UPI001FF5573A|nr:helix-turn-helix domain-containing protein [Halosolutus gelatinilyticus]